MKEACEMKFKNKDLQLIVIIVFSMILWGGSWVSGKVLVGNSPQSEVVVFWRFLLTFLSFIPVIYHLKLSVKLSRNGFIQVLLGSIFLIAYNLLFFNGLKLEKSGFGSTIVTTLNPLMTFGLSALLFKQSVNKRQAIGLFLGLIGGGILINIWQFNRLLTGGSLILLSAAFAWASLSVTSERSKRNMSAFIFSFYTYGISAVIAFFLSINKGVFAFSQLPISFWWNILYLSVGVTTFATTAYFFAATKLGANKTSSFIFLVPTSSVFLSWLILDEVPSLTTLIGGFCALIAVYLINFKRLKVRRKKLILNEAGV
jgi:drug/metabolite transporter (DMT)-like permease